MAGQFFSLRLKGVKNSSQHPVLVSLGRSIQSIDRRGSLAVNLMTPDTRHAFKVLAAQDNMTFVFFISKVAHVLYVREGVSKIEVKLDVIGTDGKFKILVESDAIVIEDLSEAFVFKHGRQSAQYYRFVISDKIPPEGGIVKKPFIDIRPFNHKNEDDDEEEEE